MPETIRLNRFLSDSGCCSRREADRLIEAGFVTVDGVPAELGLRIIPGQCIVRLRGQIVRPRGGNDSYVYLALNKPRGITCTSDRRRRDNIIQFLNYPSRVFTVGRLDRDSEGLILLTDNGDIVNKILRAGNRHEKEYLVTVDRPFPDTFLKQLESGVEILGQRTLPAKCRRCSAESFRICIHQGLNRQIRRMCAALGYEVRRLTRLRIMHITLGSLKSGSWRYLGKKELAQLFELLASSSGEAIESELENGDD